MVTDQLYLLDVHKSMGTGGIYLRVLKELEDAIAGPLLIMYQRSWESGEVCTDWKLADTSPVYKKGVREDSAIIRHRQHGLTKRKSCLTDLVFFYDKVTHLVDVDVLDFSKVFLYCSS